MVRGTETKAATLILTVICVALCLIQLVVHWPSLAEIGICKDCDILARLSYSFFHGNLLHCLVNCWCMLSVAFVFTVPLSWLLLSYGIAVSFPDMLLDTTPTVGLSAILFALLGQVSWMTKRKWAFHVWALSFITFGTLLPLLAAACGYHIASPNNILHLYSYVVGLMVGFFNSPVPWRRK